MEPVWIIIECVDEQVTCRSYKVASLDALILVSGVGRNRKRAEVI